MKSLKIKKDTKKVMPKNQAKQALKIKTNVKAGSWDWLWAWPEPQDN